MSYSIVTSNHDKKLTVTVLFCDFVKWVVLKPILTNYLLVVPWLVLGTHSDLKMGKLF